ncbi:hypothetical protein [Acetobacter syzygii]
MARSASECQMSDGMGAVLSDGEPPTGRDKTRRASQAAPLFWLH